MGLHIATTKYKIYSSFGSVLEWFDFALYGFFGQIFANLFFSPLLSSSWTPLLMTYATFAIGFVARPIGALIFGSIGDKYGRSFSLKLTPIAITISTALIAFLPTYHSIGLLSIVLLLMLRIMQGIALGGEFSMNMVYLYEFSKKWKYVWGSVGSCTGSLGIMLASAFSAFFYYSFNDYFIYNYGWRLAFLITLPLGLIVFNLRSRMKESPAFLPAEAPKHPILISLKNHKKLFLLSVGLVCLHATSYYFIFMFVPIFLEKTRHFHEAAVLINNSEFLIIHLACIPLFAFLVEKLGGFKAIIVVSLLFFFLTEPLFYLVLYGQKNIVLIALAVFSILSSLNAAIVPALLSYVLPSHIRSTLFSFSFNVAFGIFGGSIPFIGLLFLRYFKDALYPCSILIVSSMVTLFSAFTLLKWEQEKWNLKITNPSVKIA